MSNRPTKEFYYLGIAKAVSSRSTCLSKQYGAIIVKNDEVISTGYNGAPRGRKNCCEVGTCIRIKNKVSRGTAYDTTCRSVHAEQNAIISASRADMLGATMYLYGFDVIRGDVVENPSSCPVCKRLIINAGIDEIIIADKAGPLFDEEAGYGFKVIKVQEWIDNDESMNVFEQY